MESRERRLDEERKREKSSFCERWGYSSKKVRGNLARKAKKGIRQSSENNILRFLHLNL